MRSDSGDAVRATPPPYPLASHASAAIATSVRRASVADVPEAEAVRRRDAAGRVALACPQDAQHVAGRVLPEPDVDERPDDRADHLPAERGRADLVAQHAVAL